MLQLFRFGVKIDDGCFKCLEFTGEVIILDYHDE